MANEVDVRFENQGSIILLQPLTDAGQRWIDENVSSEPWQWLGGALTVDWRMAEELAALMQDDGLVIE
jgi:hypothetical protein